MILVVVDDAACGLCIGELHTYVVNGLTRCPSPIGIGWSRAVRMLLVSRTLSVIDLCFGVILPLRL
jgi:hypothetical protein